MGRADERERERHREGDGGRERERERAIRSERWSCLALYPVLKRQRLPSHFNLLLNSPRTARMGLGSEVAQGGYSGVKIKERPCNFTIDERKKPLSQNGIVSCDIFGSLAS